MDWFLYDNGLRHERVNCRARLLAVVVWWNLTDSFKRSGYFLGQNLIKEERSKVKWVVKFVKKEDIIPFYS